MIYAFFCHEEERVGGNMRNQSLLVVLGSGLLLAAAAAPAQNTSQSLPVGPFPPSSPGSNPWAYPPGTLKAGSLPAFNASAEDIKVGAKVNSIYGPAIGVIALVGGGEAVVKTAHGAARVPLTAFGKSERGLLLEISAWKLERLAAEASRRGS